MVPAHIHGGSTNMRPYSDRLAVACFGSKRRHARAWFRPTYMVAQQANETTATKLLQI